MPLNFIKKPAASTPAAAPKPAVTFGTKTAAPAVATKKPAPSIPGATASWMMKGARAKEAVVKAEAKAEMDKEARNKLWPFWMPVDNERTITFLDGELDSDGMLDIPMYNQHRIKVNGDWESFVCVAENEVCPGCESGDSKASLVGVLTVLDHTPYTIKSGPNAGKTIANSRKLFIATRQTLKLLAKQAKSVGGLTGATFEVNRTGDKEPGVGNQFIFQEKHDIDDIAIACQLKPEECAPADYTQEITYRTAAQLAELGWVKAIHGVGKEKGISTTALAKEL